MKNRIGHSTLIILLWVLSLNSNAANAAYYLGLGLGQSSFQLNQANIVADYGNLDSSSTFTNSASSFNFYGGIPLDEYLSLEFDFVSSGDISTTEGNQKFKLFDASTFAVTTMLSKQITDNTRLFGRVGAHMWDISKSSGDRDTINNAVDITYGLGADINIYGSRTRQLRIQWNHYEYDGIYIDSNDILSFSLLFEMGGDHQN